MAVQHLIHRAEERRAGFYLQFETAQNKELTHEARGVLVYLLSQPPGWKVKITDLECRGTARKRVYKLLGELIEARYIIRTCVRSPQGKVTTWIYEVYENPLSLFGEMAGEQHGR